MALFSMRMQVIKRSAGRSLMGAVAYRSAEKIHDQRQGMVHDYSRRGDVERTEMMFPVGAPAWVQGITREDFWNRVDAGEKRKDAQTARELRIMIPRELPPAERIALVRDYVNRCFVSKGMVADVAWHNKLASDGQEQPHAHCLLTMRGLCDEGFGPKSRHDWVPDPNGRTHPDGHPVMVESRADSWNSNIYYETCREDWENTANSALARAGSTERIDRRSLLERGLARLPEPALRLAFHLKELHGTMRERFGQFQVARHYRAVEARAQNVFRVIDGPATLSVLAARDSDAGREGVPGHDPTARPAPRSNESPAHKVDRFIAWFERQCERLSPSRMEPAREYGKAAPEQPRAPSRTPTTPDMER